MRIHDLKCWPEPFGAMWRGDKTHEVRRDDRGYAVNDVLHLREWDPSPDALFHWREKGYTGRVISARVAYTTPGGRFGLPADMVVMSVVVLDRSEERAP